MDTYYMALNAIAEAIAHGARPAKACMEFGIPLRDMSDDEIKLLSVLIESYR